MKTYVKNDDGKGEITFDGLPFVALPIDKLLEMPGAEATGRGILCINQRGVFRVADVTATHNNEPVEFTVSIRVERTPTSQSEADLITRTAELKDRNASLKAAKEAAGRKEVYSAISSTAVETAKQLISTAKDPIAESIRAQMNARLALAFGPASLPAGQ